MRSVERFLRTKLRALKSRSRRLIALTPATVGLRTADLPYAPSAAHFAAANRRLAALGRGIDARRKQCAGVHAGATHDHRIVAMAMVEREVDRARRAFGLFFEVFQQRGT